MSMLCWGAPKCSDSSSRARTRATLGRRRELVERLGSRYPRCAAAATKALSSGLAEPFIERLDARVRLACSLEELGELAVAAVRCAMSSPLVTNVARELDVRTVAVAVLIDDRLESAQLVCEV